jgi:hypothetical protein
MRKNNILLVLILLFSTVAQSVFGMEKKNKESMAERYASEIKKCSIECLKKLNLNKLEYKFKEEGYDELSWQKFLKYCLNAFFERCEITYHYGTLQEVSELIQIREPLGITIEVNDSVNWSLEFLRAIESE